MNLHSALAPAGPQAQHIATLWWGMLWTTTAIFAIVIVALWWAVHRGHGRARESVDRATQESTLVRVVSAAVAASIVVLFALLISSIWTGRALASLRAPSAVTISVFGHQWWWEVEYDDALPSRRVKTANEIHLPTGRPIAIRVASRDVIHSFWVPNLHGKRDLVPGIGSAIWTQIDVPGVYRGQCAEFCGRQHANMALDVVAEPQADFERWLEGQRTLAPPPQTAEQQAGHDIFMSRQCIACHTILGTSAHGTVGPDLTHLASRRRIAAGTLPNEREHLAAWILNAQAFKPASEMPPNVMPRADVQSLIAYLETLR
jgi:cytochrome c oxidase subunit II